MRKFGIKYAELHPHRRRVREAMVKLKRPADWQTVLDEWYDPDKPWPTTRRRGGPGDLIAAGASPDDDPSC